MYDSNFLHIDFYFFRFFSSNGTIRAQFTHICVHQERAFDGNELKKHPKSFLSIEQIHIQHSFTFSCFRPN